MSWSPLSYGSCDSKIQAQKEKKNNPVGLILSKRFFYKQQAVSILGFFPLSCYCICKLQLSKQELRSSLAPPKSGNLSLPLCLNPNPFDLNSNLRLLKPSIIRSIPIIHYLDLISCFCADRHCLFPSFSIHSWSFLIRRRVGIQIESNIKVEIVLFVLLFFYFFCFRSDFAVLLLMLMLFATIG